MKCFLTNMTRRQGGVSASNKLLVAAGRPAPRYQAARNRAKRNISSVSKRRIRRKFGKWKMLAAGDVMAKS